MSTQSVQNTIREEPMGDVGIKWITISWHIASGFKRNGCALVSNNTVQRSAA